MLALRRLTTTALVDLSGSEPQTKVDRPRIRVRASGYVDPRSGCMVYRIEDAEGHVLRRITAARDPQDASARYWRSIGLPSIVTSLSHMSGSQMEPAMAPRRSKPMIQAPELPLEPVSPRAPGPAGKPRRAARPAAAAQPVATQDDLFAALASAPVPRPMTAAPTPYAPLQRLDPTPVMPQRVDHRTLSPSDRPDSYLYCVVTPLDAGAALREGLVASPFEPVILTERQGISYWLSILAERQEGATSRPDDIVVLRVRRLAVDGLLEPDPDSSSSAGCPCWLLTGNSPDEG